MGKKTRSLMKPSEKRAVADLIHFLDTSPTAWHAAANISRALLKQGFVELHEKDRWNIVPGGKYFVIGKGTSLCAFVLPQKKLSRIHIAASHTDSPGFKLKPHPEIRKHEALLLGLEVYGAPILASWLNRDLGIAGKIIFSDRQGHVDSRLVMIDHSPVIIPQLAIHLDRTVNESGVTLNKQEHLMALAALNAPETSYLENLLKKEVSFQSLLNFDLFLYPLEKARTLGSNHELLASYRIDSLCSVHAALRAFERSSDKHSNSAMNMVVFWDSEEVGSSTSQGAASPFLPQILERITFALGMNREEYLRLIHSSFCLSVDLAHGVHPLYGEKHEPQHPVYMNQGVAIKVNAQQKYATHVDALGFVLQLCQKNEIPYQYYIARGDASCGSTIGPIHASLTGMPTVDIGAPQLSMHSCREVTGTKDQFYMGKLIEAFFN